MFAESNLQLAYDEDPHPDEQRRTEIRKHSDLDLIRPRKKVQLQMRSTDKFKDQFLTSQNVTMIEESEQQHFNSAMGQKASELPQAFVKTIAHMRRLLASKSAPM